MPEYFQYHAFGLNFNSELELTELKMQSFEKEDLRIVFGKNPDRLDQINAEGVLYQANPDQFLLTIEGISSYLVYQGTQITVDREKNASLNDVRLFLLGPVLGALFLQRKMLPLHGSCVVKNGVATIICGRSGAGKSTLAALLNKRGFSLLADDISIVNNLEGFPSVSMGIPQFKLWQDVAEQLYSDYSKLPRIREQLLRYRIPAQNYSSSSDNRLKQIIVLDKKNTPEFEWIEAKGMEKFSLLKDQTYREQYIVGLDTAVDHFNAVNTLLNNVRVFVLRRPDGPLLINSLTDFVEKKLIDP